MARPPFSSVSFSGGHGTLTYCMRHSVRASSAVRRQRALPCHTDGSRVGPLASGRRYCSRVRGLAGYRARARYRWPSFCVASRPWTTSPIYEASLLGQPLHQASCTTASRVVVCVTRVRRRSVTQACPGDVCPSLVRLVVKILTVSVGRPPCHYCLLRSVVRRLVLCVPHHCAALPSAYGTRGVAAPVDVPRPSPWHIQHPARQ